jgi:Tol biopolymer transport system component
MRLLKVVIIAGAAFLLFGQADTTLQKAIRKETVEGDLKGAIELYRRAIGQAAKDRATAAQALVHMGECYEKLGDAEARKAYERVVREFGDQGEQAAMARQRLAAITGAIMAKNSGEMSAHRIPIPASASLVQSDGTHIFYVDIAAGGLMAAGMDGANPRAIFPLPASRHSLISGWPRISPDGKLIALNLSTPDYNSFCVVGADGSGFRELYRKPLHGVQPLGGWSPDGRYFIGHILEPDGYTLATISVADGSMRKINTNSAVRGQALVPGGAGDFTPDGKYIFFASRPSGGPQSVILIVAVDGSYSGKLIEHPSVNLPIGFAPDGKHFLFQSDRSGRPGIYAVLVSDGKAQGEPVLVKQEPGISSGETSLSRNGTLFYTVGDRSVREAFVLDLDPATGKTVGSPQRLSAPAALPAKSAAWSSDGKKLAFISRRQYVNGGGDVVLTVRTLASAQETEWKIQSETDTVLGWAPDGSAIYTAVGFDGPSRRVELHSVAPSSGESKTSTVFPGARLIYCVRPAPQGNALLVSYGDQPWLLGRPAGVIRLDLETGQQTEIIHKGIVSEATISPDGRSVAALDRQADSTSIMVKPLEGGEWKTLARLDGAGYMYLRWLPNADLVFGREGAPNSAIYRLSVAGGTPQKIAEMASLEHVYEIGVRPDGRQLLFQSFVHDLEFWALENFLPKEFMQQ